MDIDNLDFGVGPSRVEATTNTGRSDVARLVGSTLEVEVWFAVSNSRSRTKIWNGQGRGHQKYAVPERHGQTAVQARSE